MAMNPFPIYGHTRTRGMFERLDSPPCTLRIARFAPPEPRIETSEDWKRAPWRGLTHQERPRE